MPYPAAPAKSTLSRLSEESDGFVPLCSVMQSNSLSLLEVGRCSVEHQPMWMSACRAWCMEFCEGKPLPFCRRH